MAKKTKNGFSTVLEVDFQDQDSAALVSSEAPLLGLPIAAFSVYSPAGGGCGEGAVKGAGRQRGKGGEGEAALVFVPSFFFFFFNFILFLNFT